MNKNLSLALALIAGLLGGLVTRYIAPSPAFAQGQAPITKEIRAQSFALVDPSDRTVGTFTFEPLPGAPIFLNRRFPNNQVSPDPMQMRIVLRDSNGREIWSAGGNAIRPLSER
jgi:hypothetical protein